jgi:hypothetical protein
MAQITVKRKEQKTDAVLPKDDSTYSLTALRTELLGRSLMFGPDKFKSATSGGIIAETDESGYFLADIFQLTESRIEKGRDTSGNPIIEIVKGKSREVWIEAVESSLKPITVKKGGAEPKSVKFDTEATLTQLRSSLEKLSLMVSSDRFSAKGGGAILLDSEDAFYVKEIVDTEFALNLVSGKPSRTIVVAKGEEKHTYTVEDETTLETFRLKLENAKVMSASDLFMVEAGVLAKGEEAKKKVSEAAKANVLTIKYERTLGPIDPKPILPPSPSPKIDWGQPVKYTEMGGANPPPKVTGNTFDGKLEDSWPALTWDQKRYIYHLRTLGRAVVTPTAAKLSQISKDELPRSFMCAVELRFPADGPDFTVPDRSFWSEFKSTFSLQVHEMRKRAATGVSFGGGVKGAALTSEIGVTDETVDHALKKTLYMSQMFCKPVVTLMTDIQRDVKPSPQFTAAIKEAVKDSLAERERYFRLLAVLTNWGQNIPTEFDLGGAIFFEETAKVDRNKVVKMHSFSAKGKAEATVKGVELNTGFTREESQQNENESQLEETAQNVSVIGGDPSAFNKENPAEWLKSLKMHAYWRVIRYGSFVPTIRFLEEGLRSECLALIKRYAADKDTATYTALDMMRYALMTEAALPAAEPSSEDDPYE